MLVALYSTNRDAFIGDNLNRLRTGKILNIPDRDAAAAISETEARKTVSLHAQNFNAYRKQLAETAAASSAADAPAAQVSSGKITPKVEDKAPAPAAGKDKLEVSKSEAAKDGGKAAKAVAEEDRIAKEKALKEAEARVAALEKNVADLKKLNEIKSQALADAEKKATAKPEAAKPADVAKEPAKPVEVAKNEPAKAEAPKAESPKAEVKPAEPAAPPPAADAAKPEAKPADAAAPAAEAAPPTDKPAEAAPPAPKKKAVLPLPEPEPEPTFMEEFGSFVYLGLAAVLGLGGFFGFREYKRRKDLEANTGSQFDEPSSTSSVFGTTGGQSVDTNNVSLASGFSQTSLTGNEGTAGVDPVAEAEVYMAYGRDAQAEEILLEAIKAEPTRQAVHLKLLELYAARKSIKPFEEVAKDLKQQTGGAGANWERAAALGKGIDPGNSLYGDAQSPVDTLSMDAFGTSTVIMPPGQLAKMAAMDPSKAETVVMPAVEPAAAAPVAEEEVQSFDLDLGDEPASISAPEPAPVTLDFDLDLGSDSTSGSPAASEPPPLDLEVPSISPAEAPAAPTMDIEFDLGLPATPAPAPSAPAAATNSVDFDFNLDTPAASAPAPGAINPAVDFADINLDLEKPAAPALAPEAPAVALEEDNPEVSTKLELAQAYEEMGDTEGMRELLQEVLAEGSAAQQETARSKLAQHGF
jgi:pilus assembly protein FimV